MRALDCLLLLCWDELLAPLRLHQPMQLRDVSTETRVAARRVSLLVVFSTPACNMPKAAHVSNDWVIDKRVGHVRLWVWLKHLIGQKEVGGCLGRGICIGCCDCGGCASVQEKLVSWSEKRRERQ
jgi:hypothetical protein